MPAATTYIVVVMVAVQLAESTDADIIVIHIANICPHKPYDPNANDIKGMVSVHA